jgi:hypothetical protein
MKLLDSILDALLKGLGILLAFFYGKKEEELKQQKKATETLVKVNKIKESSKRQPKGSVAKRMREFEKTKLGNLTQDK